MPIAQKQQTRLQEQQEPPRPKTGGKFLPFLSKVVDGPKTPGTPASVASVHDTAKDKGEDDGNDEEVEELSAENHPIENIMILKRRLGNGRLKKQRTDSKLSDWRREAKSKFLMTKKEAKTGDGAVIMRDLIFFRPSK